jgi:uncharacterized membrane protein SirB2
MNLFFYLVLHIIGLSTMAGTALVDFVCYRKFWKLYANGKEKAAAILPVLATFRFLFAGGFILLLISGIGMVALSHGLFAEQRWFRIKMGIILLAIINGAILGGRTAMKLRRVVAADIAGTNVEESRNSLKGRLRMIQIFQLLLFVTIFVLSVYKFN